MSQKSIRAALETAFNTWASSNTVAVAWQNRPYTPTIGTKHARAYLLPADNQNPTLGSEHYRAIGIMQVLLYVPDGAGPGAAETLIDSLVLSFKRGQSYTSGSVTVRILETPSAGTGSNENGWYVVPIFIYYTADIY